MTARSLRTWKVTVIDRGTERRWEFEVEAAHQLEAENQARIRVFREHGGRRLEAIEVREVIDGGVDVRRLVRVAPPQRETPRAGAAGRKAIEDARQALNRYVATIPLTIRIQRDGAAYIAWLQSPSEEFDDVQGQGASVQGAADSLLQRLGAAVAKDGV